MALALLPLLALGGCGGKDDEAVANLNKMASKLQDCDSQRVDYKQKYEEASAQLKRMQEQAAAVGGGTCGTITASLKTTNGGSGGPGLSFEQAKKVVFQNTGGLKVCYERALKRDSNLQLQPIKVNFRFFIHPNGSAAQASLATDTHIDQQLADCFKQAIVRWKFPTFGGEAIEFQFPLAFQPVGGK